MIIIAAENKGIRVTEYVIDSLFNDKPRAEVARILCQCPEGDIKPETFQTIQELLQSKYPKESKFLRKNLLSTINEIRKSVSDMLANESTFDDMETALGIPKMEAKAACRHLMK
jgi:hypothetical protein